MAVAVPCAPYTDAMQLPDPPRPSPILLGYSGGLDSSVLLHLMANDPSIRTTGLRAIHVHHGLHADADDWAGHCQRTCAAFDVPLRIVRVTVDQASGLGLEAAARQVRHDACAAAMGAGDILAFAHHRDDQAETFLLRALRGSGVDGLAAMPAWRSFGPGWLWRPLLATPRAALQDYARQHGLGWVEDPSNGEVACDRNFLRNAVLPLLRQRWPHAQASLSRSAALCADAVALLDGEDEVALNAVRLDAQTLQVAALHVLTPERRARVLRRWIAGLQLPPLPGQGVSRIERVLLDARRDAAARFEWSGARVCRWRDQLHAGPMSAPLAGDFTLQWDGRSPLLLPTGDRLQLLGAAGFERPIQVRARRGGERILLPGRRHTHTLKHLLQEAALPPWQRARLPLLFDHDDALLAAGDRILSARLHAWLEPQQAKLQWTCVA